MGDNDERTAVRLRPAGGVAAALNRRWLSTAVIFLIVLGAGITGARMYPTSWAATAVVSFAPRPEVGIPVDTVALVAERYAVVVASDASARRISASVPGSTTSDIAAAISTELEPGTGNLRITVKEPRRVMAVAAANAASRDLVDVAADDDLVNASLSAAATERGATITPPRTLLYAAAAVAATLLAIVAGVILDQLIAARARRRARRLRRTVAPAPDGVGDSSAPPAREVTSAGPTRPSTTNQAAPGATATGNGRVEPPVPDGGTTTSPAPTRVVQRKRSR